MQRNKEIQITSTEVFKNQSKVGIWRSKDIAPVSSTLSTKSMIDNEQWPQTYLRSGTCTLA